MAQLNKTFFVWTPPCHQRLKLFYIFIKESEKRLMDLHNKCCYYWCARRRLNCKHFLRSQSIKNNVETIFYIFLSALCSLYIYSDDGIFGYWLTSGSIVKIENC